MPQNKKVTDTAIPAEPPGTQSLHDFEPLLSAERIVLRAAASGDIAKVSFRRPRSPTPEVRVRGEFLAFLARGGGANARVAGRRLQVMGACITGRVDLAGALVPMSVWLFRCTFGAVPVLDSARVLGSLTFSDSALPGLRAEGCRFDGDLALNAGCNFAGEIQLTGSAIGRDLDGERLHMRRFVAKGMQIGGDVIFEGNAEAVGEVCFLAARIGGSMRASGARLSADVDEAGARGVALNLDRVHIGGDLLLNAGFTAAGTVRLAQARIRGNLDGSAAEFDAIGDASWGENGSALRLDRARIGGALILRDLKGPLQGASLVDTQVGTLTDDASSWGQHHALDGFAYTRFGPGAPIDAATRLSWLSRQEGAHLDLDYRPDPWRRLLKALRRGGHAHSAAEVAIGRERHLRRIGRIGRTAPPALAWIARAAHAAWGVVAGYGHRPLRLLVAAVVVWLACGGAYWTAAARGAFVPAAAWSGADAGLSNCRADCAGLPTFRPFVYSLEVLLPLSDLRRDRRWVAARVAMLPEVEPMVAVPALQFLVWFEAACGWALCLTWIAGLLGIGDRDRGLG
jgi:hypothetical protein